MIGFGDTWRCHVCGAERPDSAISVASRTEYIGRIPMQINVRYCNDNPSCIAAAPTYSFFRDEPGHAPAIATREGAPPRRKRWWRR